MEDNDKGGNEPGESTRILESIPEIWHSLEREMTDSELEYWV